MPDIEQPNQTPDQSLTVEKVLRLERYARQEYAERLEAIRKNHSMFRGGEGQWNEKTASYLKGQGRPVHSINIELPLVLQLLGSFRQQPKDWRAIPVDDLADEQTATTYTKILKHISNDNDLDYVIDDVRQQGVVGSIGIYYVETERDDVNQPRISVSLGDNTMILVDPDAKRIDQKDWKWVVRSAWMRWSDIQAAWPETAPKAHPKSQFLAAWWETVSSRLRQWFKGDVDTELIDTKNDLYRVTELWEMEKERVDVIERLNPQTTEYERKTVKEMTDQEDVLNLQADGWTKISSGKRDRLKLTVVLPYTDTVLAEQSFPYKYYPFIIFLPLRIAGTPIPDCFSYTENLHSLQEEKNVSHSVLTDAMQRMPLGGAILPSGEDELQKDMEGRASQPGQYFTRKTQAGEIIWLDQKFPSGYANLLSANDADIRMVSGQPLAAAGISESSEETGILFQSKVQQGLTSLMSIFMSEAFSRRFLGRVLIDRIQKDYTSEMVFRITGMDEENKMSPEVLVINKGIVDDVLNDLDNGRYDVILDEEPLARSEREMQFRAWSELVKGLAPEMQAILAPELVELSGLPNRKLVANKLRGLVPPMPGIPGDGLNQPALPQAQGFSQQRPEEAGGLPPG